MRALDDTPVIAKKESTVSERIHEIHINLVERLAVIMVKLDSFDDKFSEIKKEVASIKMTSEENKEQLQKSKAVYDFLWVRVVQNFGWIISGYCLVSKYLHH
jgi:hypothetical protein